MEQKDIMFSYMDTDCLIPLIKKDDFCKDIAEHGEKWLKTPNYDKRRRKKLSRVGKKKKITDLMKDERPG